VQSKSNASGIPEHFDRDVAYRHPSCQRSVVIRPFITEDFMTDISAEVSRLNYNYLILLRQIVF
jgi:hypothetical protein